MTKEDECLSSSMVMTVQDWFGPRNTMENTVLLFVLLFVYTRTVQRLVNLPTKEQAFSGYLGTYNRR